MKTYIWGREAVCSALLFAAPLFLFASCENQSNPSQVAAHSSSSPLTAVSDTGVLDVDNTPAQEESIILDDNSPTPTIDIEWANGDTEKNVLNTDVLSLKVTNHLDIPATVKVAVHTAGILEETADVDLGSFIVDALGEIYVDVSNDALPMQTTKGVCQAYATAKALYNNGQEDSVEISGSAPLYYRQLPNYKRMLVFGRKIFLKEYQGRFTDLMSEARNNGLDVAKETVLGRVKQNGKNFEDVTLNSVIAAKKQDGELILLGTGTGSAGSYAEEEEAMRHAR